VAITVVGDVDTIRINMVVRVVWLPRGQVKRGPVAYAEFGDWVLGNSAYFDGVSGCSCGVKRRILVRGGYEGILGSWLYRTVLFDTVTKCCVARDAETAGENSQGCQSTYCPCPVLEIY
jgi:hypothetical protein